jgi:hypothetical protein
VLSVHAAVCLRAELVWLEPAEGPQWKALGILGPSGRRVGQRGRVGHVGQDALGEGVLTLEGQKNRRGRELSVHWQLHLLQGPSGSRHS